MNPWRVYVALLLSGATLCTVEIAADWRAAAVQAASRPLNLVLLEGDLFMERPQEQARYPVRARHALFSAAMLCIKLAWGNGSQEEQRE